jgi:D-arabinose 1-dehydrogenase-like Zn-dependent alcohol dehydrogenase
LTLTVNRHCPALLSKKASQAGFQHYTSIPQILAAPIPSSMTFAQATVLPLGVSTAAAGLYQKDFLGLQLPSASAKSTGKTILVWGGASSVGSCAIQLLAHSGYEVVTTASKHNFDYCKSLGAAQVFDYTSSSCNDDIIKTLKGKQVHGIYDSISLPPTIKACATIAVEADIEKKFVALTLPPPEAKTPGVELKSVFAITILHNEVGPAIYKNFLPSAMEKGDFKAKPDPIVIGSGLEKVQEGMDKLKAGVSAGKVVIEL